MFKCLFKHDVMLDGRATREYGNLYLSRIGTNVPKIIFPSPSLAVLTSPTAEDMMTSLRGAKFRPVIKYRIFEECKKSACSKRDRNMASRFRLGSGVYLSADRTCELSRQIPDLVELDVPRDAEIYAEFVHKSPTDQLLGRPPQYVLKIRDWGGQDVFRVRPGIPGLDHYSPSFVASVASEHIFVTKKGRAWFEAVAPDRVEFLSMEMA